MPCARLVRVGPIPINKENEADYTGRNCIHLPMRPFVSYLYPLLSKTSYLAVRVFIACISIINKSADERKVLTDPKLEVPSSHPLTSRGLKPKQESKTDSLLIYHTTRLNSAAKNASARLCLHFINSYSEE